MGVLGVAQQGLGLVVRHACPGETQGGQRRQSWARSLGFCRRLGRPGVRTASTVPGREPPQRNFILEQRPKWLFRENTPLHFICDICLGHKKARARSELYLLASPALAEKSCAGRFAGRSLLLGPLPAGP